MSIEAINEQLLRAIGVGVALVRLDALTLSFRNDTFIEWFGEAERDARLGDIFPTLDVAALRTGLETDGRFTAELSFKLRRRTMTVALCSNRISGPSPVITESPRRWFRPIGRVAHPLARQAFETAPR